MQLFIIILFALFILFLLCRNESLRQKLKAEKEELASWKQAKHHWHTLWDVARLRNANLTRQLQKYGFTPEE